MQQCIKNKNMFNEIESYSINRRYSHYEAIATMGFCMLTSIEQKHIKVICNKKENFYIIVVNIIAVDVT